MSAPQPRLVAERLSRWFEKAARDMTWRRTRDPYAIWVSEIMLQQTRVETVERYYADFMAQFPSVERLAAADEEAVLAAWSGLGYYRRARLLHRGARHVLEEHRGRVPESASELREVPGIGRYTAGAISSIAFDRPEPLVDGNVARVLSRLYALDDVREQDATHAAHWQRVREILEHGSPRILAQALMELGATVCTPRNPSCDGCPVRGSCRARLLNRQGSIPAPKKRKASPRVEYDALLLCWGDQVLLERRPTSGLLAGMWCPPLIERNGLRPPRRDSVERFIGVPVRRECGDSTPIEHVFTHRVWVLHPWLARVGKRPRLRTRDDDKVLRWYPSEVDGGVPSVASKLLARATGGN